MKLTPTERRRVVCSNLMVDDDQPVTILRFGSLYDVIDRAGVIVASGFRSLAGAVALFPQARIAVPNMVAA